jgi:hypothetical protein
MIFADDISFLEVLFITAVYGAVHETLFLQSLFMCLVVFCLVVKMSATDISRPENNGVLCPIFFHFEKLTILGLQVILFNTVSQ